MKSEKLLDAVGRIDDELVQGALGAARRPQRPGWAKWAAAAACLCLLAAAAAAPALLRSQQDGGRVVSASGFLTLTAHAASPEDGAAGNPGTAGDVVMLEGMEIPVDSWSPAMSSRPGIPFSLSAPEYPDAVFEVSADGGELILWEGGHVTPLETPFTAVNGGTIYWSDLSPAGNGDRAYIDIVTLVGENIVGYAVVEIYVSDYVYYAKLLKSVSFPQVDGSYQAISGEYVRAEMERARGEGSGG